MHRNARSYYTPNEHGRELLGLPPTKISYATGTDYITCAECPHCKPRGIREDGFLGAGYQYGICGQGGNLVFLEPWKEKRIHGSGYIHHKVSSCEMYEKGKRRTKMEYIGEEFRMWCEERDRAILSGDVKKFRAFYECWRDKGMYDRPLPADDRIVDCAIHKMVLCLANATEDERQATKQWLREHGYGLD